MKADIMPERGQIWLAADGGGYGYEIKGLDNYGDAIVEAFVIDRGNPRTIDPHKLNYRYKLANQLEENDRNLA